LTRVGTLDTMGNQVSKRLNIKLKEVNIMVNLTKRVAVNTTTTNVGTFNVKLSSATVEMRKTILKQVLATQGQPINTIMAKVGLDNRYGYEVMMAMSVGKSLGNGERTPALNLITRVPNEEDYREKLVYLTPKGNKLLNSLNECGLL